MSLFQLPKVLGQYQNKDVVVNIGRFGPYVMYNGTFASIPKEEDPYTITLERAIELIEAKQSSNQSRIIQNFESEGIQVLNGRFGPYISYNKKNYKIPKDKDPKSLTLDEIIAIIGNDYKQELAEVAAKPEETNKDNKKITTKKTAASSTSKKTTSSKGKKK